MRQRGIGAGAAGGAPGGPAGGGGLAAPGSEPGARGGAGARGTLVDDALMDGTLLDGKDAGGADDSGTDTGGAATGAADTAFGEDGAAAPGTVGSDTAVAAVLAMAGARLPLALALRRISRQQQAVNDQARARRLGCPFESFPLLPLARPLHTAFFASRGCDGLRGTVILPQDRAPDAHAAAATMDEHNPYRAPDAAAALPPSRPAGLGGAMIAVAAILVVSALTSALSLGAALLVWDRFAPAQASYLRAQIVFDALLLPLALVALTLFFRRSSWFPRTFAAWAAVATLAKAVRPLMMFNAGDINLIQALAMPLGLALFWYGPWSLYVLRSRRSRDTFGATR